MKLHPSFDHDRLIFVGAGIFPWLTRDYWILSDHLEGRLVRLGKKKIIKLQRHELKHRYENGKLTVMGRRVEASEVILLQLVRWIEDWKKHE